jgi:hypothetical protein
MRHIHRATFTLCLELLCHNALAEHRLPALRAAASEDLKPKEDIYANACRDMLLQQ